jgi:hypothetical protein
VSKSPEHDRLEFGSIRVLRYPRHGNAVRGGKMKCKSMIAAMALLMMSGAAYDKKAEARYCTLTREQAFEIGVEFRGEREIRAAEIERQRRAEWKRIEQSADPQRIKAADWTPTSEQPSSTCTAPTSIKPIGSIG